MMNRCVVLISSVSAKTEMIRSVRHGFAKLDPAVVIIGADANSTCLARNHVDDFIIMPFLDQIVIADFITGLLAKGVTHIIPSRDGELLFYATHYDRFIAAGIRIMVASASALETCLDKYRFYQQLSDELPVIKTTLATNDEVSRWVVKERFGSASSGLLLDVSTESAIAKSDQLNTPVYQPYVEGQEYSIDLYISSDYVCLGYVVRSRDVIVDGEAKVTTSRDRPDIGELAVSTARAIKLTGHCLVQIIEDKLGQLHIVEINPRYGGSSGLSVDLGLDSFYWFALESSGEPLDGDLFNGYCADQTLNKLEHNQGRPSDED